MYKDERDKPRMLGWSLDIFHCIYSSRFFFFFSGPVISGYIFGFYSGGHPAAH